MTLGIRWLALAPDSGFGDASEAYLSGLRAAGIPVSWHAPPVITSLRPAWAAYPEARSRSRTFRKPSPCRLEDGESGSN